MSISVLCVSLYTVVLLNFSRKCLTFNIDTQDAIVYRGKNGSYFGYKVQTYGDSNHPRIIVADPLTSDPTKVGSGAIYNCDPKVKTCEPVDIPASPVFKINGIGLSMDTSPKNMTPELLVCAPGLTYTCGSNTYVNGICYRLDNTLNTLTNMTAAFEGCPPAQLDVAFLIDGSGSIEFDDFRKMQEFMLKVISQLKEKGVMFAVVQFSEDVKTEFSFEDFRRSSNYSRLVHGIAQMGHMTYTQSGIKYVAEEVFTPQAGSRPESKKLMIVITDGESNDQSVTFPEALKAADDKGILRYAIGVGNVFEEETARDGLRIIGSKPSKDFVFQVDSYAALKEIEDALKDKIFAIEGGSNSLNTSSFQRELAQTGFSSLYTKDSIFLGSVGSYDWAGEVVDIRNSEETPIRPSIVEPNAYFGYTLAGVYHEEGFHLAVGAPRHDHKGAVFIQERVLKEWRTRQIIKGEQIGSYFGFELCSLDLDDDGLTDLILIGCPCYTSDDRGGTVLVCSLSPQGQFSCNISLWGEGGEYLGRFGSSIVGIGDMTGDGVTDVAIGAPLEREGWGAVYVYPGKTGGLEATYSQRIEGSSMKGGFLYFGGSLSGSRDLNEDGTPDLVVGARGGVYVLSASPVLSVRASVFLSPPEMSVMGSDCALEQRVERGSLNITLCFLLEKRTQQSSDPRQVSLEFTADLEPNRQKNRLRFGQAERSVKQRILITPGVNCVTLSVSVQHCIEDILTKGEMFLDYCTFVDRSGGDRHVFRNDCKERLNWPIPFENTCKNASHCVSDLHLEANLTSSGNLFIEGGTQFDLKIILSNFGEISLRPFVKIQHPTELSIRKITIIKSAVTVNCEETEREKEFLESQCKLGDFAVRGGVEIIFLVTFDVSEKANFSDFFTLNLLALSDNELTETLQDNRVEQNVTIGRTVNIAIRSADSLNYVNFTKGLKSVLKVTHEYQVINMGRHSLPISISFRFLHRSPVYTWDVIIVEPNQVRCNASMKVTVHDPRSKANQHCTKVECREIHCKLTQLYPQSSIIFTLKGNLTIDGNVQNETGKYLWSLAHLDFDRNKFSLIGERMNAEKLPSANITTLVEMLETVDFTLYIAGGGAGGIILLIIIGLICYKVGFFKRRYKTTMNEGNNLESSMPLNPQSPPPTATDE